MKKHYAIELDKGKKVIREFEEFMETSKSYVVKKATAEYVIYPKQRVFSTFSEALDVLEREYI